MKLLNFFFHFFFSRKFYLVNSPIQYLCMMEYFHTKNLKISEFTIIVGYCSLSSKKQIKILNKEFDNFNQNIFFLDELLNINIFHLLFFVQKKIKRKFLLTVGAAYNYYLFKEFFKKSKKVVFIDDGLEILDTINNEEIKNDEIEIFTVFNLKKDRFKIEKNNFDFIRKFDQKKSQDKELIFLLGTAIFNPEIRAQAYIDLLKDFFLANKDKKIIYFPHRSEKTIFDKLKFNNLEVRYINVPIEVYILKQNIFPEIIAGFYSAALYNLKLIYPNTRTRVININFDNKNQKWLEGDRPYFHDFLVEHLKEVKVENFY
jgi:hypothetical protein